jgi:patatin-related protein
LTPITTVVDGDREELRLALVMNGGVSLAVWIGGVAMEISRLVRGEGVYGELLELTQSVARADVMAGASAGGINGALLSMAISHGQSLEPLRGVWLESGALMKLFRSPFQADPPSLMKGDEFFLERLREVFKQMVPGNSTPTEDYPIDLTITTTMMRGERLDYDDDFGLTIHDTTYRGQFNFRRVGARDDFKTDNDAERLALAARCTASFPGAFEASYVPVGTTTSAPARPDMAGIANFSSSRYTIDGGVLVNKPIRPVLRSIFSQPAERQVRRVLAYIVPDPGPLSKDDPGEDETPTIGMVVKNTVLLPRQESIGQDLDDLQEHNRRVRGQRQIRDLLLGDAVPVDFTAIAGLLFSAYRASRLEDSTQYVLDQLSIGTRRIAAAGGIPGVPAHTWTRTQLRQALRTALDAQIPVSLPPSQQDVPGWGWDVRAVENVAVVALDVLRQGLALAPLPSGRDAGKDPWSDRRAALRTSRGSLHDLLGELRQIRGRDIDFWKAEAPVFGRCEVAADLPPAAETAVQSWMAGPLSGLSALPLRMADVLVSAGGTLWQSARAAIDLDPVDANKLMAKLSGLAVPEQADAAAGGAAATECLRRLLALAVAQQALTSGLAVLEQSVELAQVNAYAKNGFDGRTLADEKLAGVQLGHFGAFYKQSWRANDWMWGRLDGADRLALILLSPARIQKLAQATGQSGGALVTLVLDAIEQVALGSDGPTRAVLSARWDRAKAEEELAFLATPGTDPPHNLDYCARGVARRIQLEAITDELPHIAQAILSDKVEGAAESTETVKLADAVLAAQKAALVNGRTTISPDAAVDFFLRCQVGREKILAEVGSDLLTNTAVTAAAVAVSAAGGKRGGIPFVRSVIASVRTFFLTLYVLTRGAVGKKGRTGLVVLVGALAAGGAILAVSLPLDHNLPGWLSGLGIVLVLAGLFLATLRAGLLWTLFIVVIPTLALAIVPFVLLRYHLGPAPLDGWRKHLHDLAIAGPIVGLVLGSMALGLVHRPRPKKQPPPGPAPRP